MTATAARITSTPPVALGHRGLRDISPSLGKPRRRATGISPISRMQYSGAKFAVPSRFAGFGLASNSSNAMKGASTGASVGTQIMPGIGTAVGAVVGGVVGAVANPVHNLITGGESDAHKQWEAYKPKAGAILGRQMGDQQFAEPVKGMFDSNTDVLGSGSGREQWLSDMAKQILSAVQAGAVPSTADAPWIYTQVVRPWALATKHFKKPEFAVMGQLFTDAIDRYINNVPIARADMPFYAKGGYSVHIPFLSASLGANVAANTTTGIYAPSNAGTLAAAVAPTPVAMSPLTPVSIAPTSPSQISSVAASGPTMSATGLPDLTGLISQVMAQGANQQQAYAAAMQSLSNQGVPATAAVQSDVAGQVAAVAQAPGNMIFGIPTTTLMIAGGGLLAVYLLMHKKGAAK